MIILNTLKQHRFHYLSAYIILYVLSSCNTKIESTDDFAEKEKLYKDSIASLNLQLNNAKSQIDILKFPADQRLNHIIDLFNAQEYANVKKEVSELKHIFPNAIENAEADTYLKKIETIEAERKAEEERIKALGFKAFVDNPTITFEKVTYSFSGFTYGRTFTFEYVYDVDEYYYEVADKDCTYILASLTISTKESSASEPSVYAFEIVDGKLKKINKFRIEYASYNTYGAKIGNYSETSHDFSKVSSVKYKMAAEIPQSYTNKPIVIAVKNAYGMVSDEITIEDVKKEYTVVKILNRNKL